MHPIVAEQIAWSRGEELRRRAARQRQVALMRRASPARHTEHVRRALAGVALQVARALDPDGRPVRSLGAP